MIQFQQSESTAERRRWVIVLVDAADGVTGLTGQTGTVFISKNGSAGVASTNSLVEVDAGDMPGQYYVELTAAELNTLGWIAISKKTAGSLAFHDRAIVSYNDPYQSAGGFSGGGTGESFKLTKKHIQDIAEAVWKYAVQEEVTAQAKLLEAATHPIVDMAPVMDKIDAINIPDLDLSPVLDSIGKIKMPVLDLAPVLKKIEAINIPAPINHSTEIQSLAKQINEAVAKLDKPDVLSPEVSKLLSEVATLQDNFDNKITAVLDKDNGAQSVQDLLKEIQAELERKLKLVFEQLLQVKLHNQKIEEEIINSKHDLLEDNIK